MKILADLHLHTVASGHAFSTIEEYLTAAKKIGLKYLAFTDHGPKMPGGAHWYHFCNLKALPSKLNGIRVISGIEANIINPQGELDLPQKDLESLNMVLIAFHPRCGYEKGDVKQNTKVLKKAMENKAVTAIAHPGNIYFPVDIKEIVGYAKETGVLIEINNATLAGWARQGSRGNCLEFAKEVKRQNWYVCLGSDSHYINTVGQFKEALELVGEAQIPTDHVINTAGELIDEWILNKKRL